MKQQRWYFSLDNKINLFVQLQNSFLKLVFLSICRTSRKYSTKQQSYVLNKWPKLSAKIFAYFIEILWFSVGVFYSESP